jgi:hypothetical protein
MMRKDNLHIIIIIITTTIIITIKCILAFTSASQQYFSAFPLFRVSGNLRTSLQHLQDTGADTCS